MAQTSYTDAYYKLDYRHGFSELLVSYEEIVLSYLEIYYADKF